jgi:hypothetical protein
MLPYFKELSDEELERLPTHRLLAYYRKIYKETTKYFVRLEGNAMYTDPKGIAMDKYVVKVKSLLNKREHLER